LRRPAQTEDLQSEPLFEDITGGDKHLKKDQIRLSTAKDKRFDSWKEISLYLKRSTRTCFQWSKDLGLPVYRINKTSKRSRVFAFKSEIDKWLLVKKTVRSRVSNLA
jgi:hypothetical protein